MKGKIISILVTALLITTFAAPVIGISVKKAQETIGDRDVSLDVAITTDWVDDWQQHGLLIREFALDGEVWAYHEISSDDLFGLYFEQTWWYDNGTGLEDKWSWAWTITEHWTSSATWSWWQIGLDYGPGVGYVECLIDNVSIGVSNWYAIDNHQPDDPTIEGPTSGSAGTAIDYEFTGTDPENYDEISYYVDWGDDTNSGWTEYVAPGTMVTLDHTWEKGDYTITCKTRDLAHNESNEVTLDISIPRNRPVEYRNTLLIWLFNRFPVLRGLLG
jgi:hypothetical protein